MPVRRKLLLAFAFALALQMLQMAAVSMFIQRTQLSVEGITLAVSARQMNVFASDIVATARALVDGIPTMADPKEGCKAVDVYLQELSATVNELLRRGHDQELDAKSIERLEVTLADVMDEHAQLRDAVVQAAPDAEATEEHVLFVDESLDSLAESLSIFGVRLDKRLQAAAAAERRIHDRPIQAGMAITIVAAFSLSAFAWIFSGRFVRPVQRLSAVLQRVSSNEQLSQRVPVTGNDEITELSKSFNSMADRIEREFAERRRAEAELQSTQQKLVETARRAGMAEIATDVLHNVGNVLNSVNVSASLATDKVRAVRVSSLSKVVSLLDEHDSNLAAFMTSDAKGKRLPAYLADLANYLASEQNAVLEELESLVRDVDHIRDIVRTQQSYAGISGVAETLPISDLFEDALAMLDNSLRRHAIKVVRQYAEVPPIAVEKAKLLQVLVNLTKNAKEALVEGDKKDKVMTVRVATTDDHQLRIEIADNGVGIPEENLERIFTHGFTSKENGNGFGLHVSANVVGEMNGSLTASSGGPGQGASFVVRLPVCTPQEELSVA